MNFISVTIIGNFIDKANTVSRFCYFLQIFKIQTENKKEGSTHECLIECWLPFLLTFIFTVAGFILLLKDGMRLLKYRIRVIELMEAFRLFKNSAENGYPEGMYNLAKCYENSIKKELEYLKTKQKLLNYIKKPMLTDALMQHFV